MIFFPEELAGEFYIRDNEIRPGSEFNDRFLHKGKNLYEVVRVIDRVPLFLSDHLLRLKNSSEKAGYPLDPEEEKISISLRLLTESEGLDDGNVKLVFHYGGKADDNFFTAYFVPHHYPSPKNYRKGVRVTTLMEERPEPGIKNWRPDFRRRIMNLKSSTSVYEVILINESGFVTEGSQSNIFILSGDTLYTAPESQVLPGITRKYVFTICRREKIPLQEKNFTPDELLHADAVFLTGTSPKILPVSRIDQARYKQNNKLVRLIADRYDEMLNDYIKQHT